MFCYSDGIIIYYEFSYGGCMEEQGFDIRVINNLDFRVGLD